jgi:hypothetical protein
LTSSKDRGFTSSLALQKSWQQGTGRFGGLGAGLSLLAGRIATEPHLGKQVLGRCTRLTEIER